MLTDDFKGFMFLFPVRVVALSASIDQGNLTCTGLAHVVVDGKQYLAVFTDKDLADQFIINSGRVDSTIVAFDTQKSFVNFLRSLIGTNTEGIAIDPGVSGRASFYDDLSKLINDLEG